MELGAAQAMEASGSALRDEWDRNNHPQHEHSNPSGISRLEHHEIALTLGWQEEELPTVPDQATQDDPAEVPHRIHIIVGDRHEVAQDQGVSLSGHAVAHARYDGGAESPSERTLEAVVPFGREQVRVETQPLDHLTRWA